MLVTTKTILFGSFGGISLEKQLTNAEMQKKMETCRIHCERQSPGVRKGNCAVKLVH